jgi:hypothetical protein
MDEQIGATPCVHLHNGEPAGSCAVLQRTSERLARQIEALQGALDGSRENVNEAEQELVGVYKRVEELETAASRLLRKFHVETECGQPDHWAECEALSYALGPDRG